ncbi:MAG TPA: glutamine--fructose-6-phosphate transaminase (isomerizing) [Acidimicrobiales bacterium]|jgi:glucosamine--fructose-6-phosphate aminotransferase (isomerizing)|nr:glutamine--fructose-6-phosphate transaminase (isomerizing) [Acidimicrobiales bacterium]
MCGIIGVTGEADALPLLLGALHQLEYRGYDSAGVALVADGEVWRARKARAKPIPGVVTPSPVAELATLTAGAPASGTHAAGIGHVRWATHGHPTDDNAHPHVDCTGRLALVHNGIIENHLELKADLESKGHIFTSATDTEVMAHLLEEHLASDPGIDLAEATRRMLRAVRGAFSIAVVHADEPDTLVGARRSTPLVFGLHDGAALLASDIPALIGHTTQVFALADDELAVLTPGHATVTTLDGAAVTPEPLTITWNLEAAQKGGYDDFMSKEIHEQPEAIANTLLERHALVGAVALDEVRIPDKALRAVDKVFIVACGSSYHAALVAKYAIEQWAKLPTEVDIASEFRYRNPVVNERTLFVGVSQSGETLDTSEAQREAARLGAKVLVVTNVVDSSMARAADGVLYTRAGPEIGVASTKCHLAQIVALEVLGLYLAQVQGALPAPEINGVLDAMETLPGLVTTALDRAGDVDDVAAKLTDARDFFFLGRHVGFPVALEGALKLKELAYLRAEGYPAGELKHGPIALIEPGTVVVGIATRTPLWEKMLSNVAEVRSRGATVVLLANDGDEESAAAADHVLWVPPAEPLLSPVVGVVPLQQLAYRLARLHGHDPDRPRNLAKTVTVE